VTTPRGATFHHVLHVHRAERADRLAGGLAETLLEPLDNPFAPDIVAVPTRGIERWLTQRLSTRLGASEGRRDGVCANVEFPFPARLIVGALAAATGIDPEGDPWLPERSVWPLLEVVDECLEEPWLATLELHLRGGRGAPEDAARRFGVVRHIADLFDRYGVHRPDMVRGWAHGADDHDWQPELWRRLRRRIAGPSPAERLITACERIRDAPGVLDLPARLSLFGLTRIPRAYVDVLRAIAEQREVHMFLLHPSPSLWRQVEQELRDGAPIITRREDRTAVLPDNRLLASWGRDARELQLVIAGAGEAIDHHHKLTAGEPRTLLEAVQADVRADRRPPGSPLPDAPDARPQLAADDRSVQIHACHGRARQVEVLRDAVLHLLEDDPTLEPRDVIVMCPDIETFAPLIQATFGSARHPGGDAEDEEAVRGGLDDQRLPDVRVRLADRSLRQTNPVLGVVSRLLGLADQRATASQLLDLASREPVRRRFGFDDESLSRMQEWVAASGIRWGFDASHREAYKLGSLNANTWRSGLDRILAGVTMTEEDRRLIRGVLPLDDVESGAIELAGRFAEFIERTRAAVDDLCAPKPIAGWTRAIADAADALTATGDRESWQRRELQRLLDEVDAQSARDIGAGPVLELGDVRVLLADRLRGRPTRANFRTGHLTVCTLVPMRSVPHRVVCILGLDDGEFPRRARRDGDDLTLAHPHVGDRDPRAEDRQMLLDALLAATERLIITYTGNDERTNLRRPPAVPVGELLDIVERTVSRADGPARDQVVIHHPLQPFDPRNFTAGDVLGEQPWGFDRHALGGARALTATRSQRRPFLTDPLPARRENLVELASLARFVEHPVRTLLRDRLGISVSQFRDEVEDGLPVELDGLGEWGVGQRLLDGVMAGAELTACMKAEIARGALPPGELGKPPLARIAGAVGQLAAEARALAGGETAAGSLDVNVALPDGRTLAGTVTGVCGDLIRASSYSRVRPRDRLRAWVKLLALTAARPERPFESVVIGRARAGAEVADVTVARIPPLGGDPAERRDAALADLQVILDLYDRGMREPLPLSSDASAAYAQAVAAGRDGAAAAQQAWASAYDRPKEDRQPEHLLVYGKQLEFAELLGQRPRADENWVPTDPTRFGRYARRLWDGLLARESVSER
jgi:exodeoxyribonuclease V gamma subunit